MKTTYKSIWAFALTVISSAAFLTACEDTDYPAAQPATGPSTVLSRFLFVNAAPGAPALNFLVENNPVAQSIAFGQAAAAYAGVPAGTIQLRAKAATGTIGGVIGSNDILFRAGATNQNNFAAAANTSYTVFVTDTLNRPAPTGTGQTNPGGPQLIVVTDPLTQTLAAGAGGVRFFHLAPDVGLPASSTATTPSAVSVRLSLPTSATTAVTSFTNRAYRNVATNTFTSVPAGTYQVDVFTGGAITGTPVSSTTVTVEASKLYTLYARGLVRNRTLSVGRVQHN